MNENQDDHLESMNREEDLKAGERLVKTVNGVEYAFRWCPPGTFLMGSPESEEGFWYGEKQHEVTLTQGFWMLETPVTQELWESVMVTSISEKAEQGLYDDRVVGDSTHLVGEGPNYPMYYLTWNDCQRFCETLSGMTGLEISLPTEAQWEYACRAGSTAPFSFGWKLNGTEANCNGTTPYGTTEEGPYLEETTPVKSYEPNAWGLYDMHGNVDEWCREWFDDHYYYTQSASVDPAGPDDCDFIINRDGRWIIINEFLKCRRENDSHVSRGGGWDSKAESCRAASRNRFPTNYRGDSMGFRFVCLSDLETIRHFEEEPKRIEQAIQSQKETAPDGETRLVKTVDGVEYVFCWCPPGSFLMGSPEREKERSSSEILHEVTLTRGFWMLQTPVTQKMWESVMGSNPSCFKGADRPVETVSWSDCLSFCEKLSGKIGMKISLPTEAQWEYACRAGTTTPFHFGSALDGLDANCDGSRPYGWSKEGLSLEETTQVKRHSPNAWGLCDMHGNVYEWCQDWSGDYPSEPAVDPAGPESGSRSVCRGGSWCSYAVDCRSASRSEFSEGSRIDCLGFRIVGSGE
ncbi:MAG: formylglycine-generating enzyme family protein [Thermoguttaceae bacterium]|nr:formylglycine-generating enzyme family protein [Thermoguttaceae bacterium]